MSYLSSVFLLSLLLAIPLRAQTITTNTVWHAANSPFFITANVVVNNGVTLTIEPGSTLYLGSGVKITVNNGGRILAEGTTNAPIVFTRNPATTARWGGITINGAIGSPESRIAYAEIDSNGAIAIHTSSGSLYLDHASFGTPDFQYVSLDTSSFTISNCLFPSSGSSLELLHGTGGVRSDGHGVVRRNFFGFTTGYDDVMDFTGSQRSHLPIIEYYNNVFIGSSDDILDLDGTDAWIEGNIFLHSHKNGAPDSSAAVSGGNNSGNTSEITVIGNIFFDCDEAATAKQGNFYTYFNNTIVHTTKTGGLDTASGVLNVRDLDPGPPTTFGAGFYSEGNIIVDAEQLVRNYDSNQTSVVFNNNIVPFAWTGPGTNNTIVDPMFKHVPIVSETHFTNWLSAQVMWDWLSLLPGSPAIGTGPNGRDKGAVNPYGVSISGEPRGTTPATTATLTIGINRTGNGIPTPDWPQGSGFIAYKWRLDGGNWSAETPIQTPLVLTNLSNGPHTVDVTGKQDSGTYQDDPLLGAEAVISHSKTWTVGTPFVISSITAIPNPTITFTTTPASTYTVQYTDSLSPINWKKLSDVPAQSTAGNFQVTDPAVLGNARFYRVVSPAQP